MKFFFQLIFVSTWIVIFLTGCGTNEVVDENANKPGFFAWIESDSLQEWTLELDTAEINKHKEEEKFCAAKLELSLKGNRVNLPVEVSCRGKTRKKICHFPPLKLRVKDSLLEAESLGSFNNYKLVTHCLQEDTLQELVLKEYLVYQLYEIVTSYAFKTQLLRIHYKDRANQSLNYSFLLEDDKEMAARLGGQLLDNDEKAPGRIYKPVYQDLVFFQYMIGNTDWNLTEYHNLEMVEKEDLSSPVPVPYDFDYSGLVNAPYATPHPSLPVKSVRERLFQYRGRKTDDLTASRQKFLDLKPEFLQRIENLTQLNPATRTNLRDYILSFYKIIEADNWKEKLFKNR